MLSSLTFFTGRDPRTTRVTLQRLLLAVLLVNALASCGGSTEVATGRTGGTGAPAASSDVVASGTIDAFGSVIVNGLRFEVAPATAVSVDDGAFASESDLRIGMVVRVEGGSSSGSLVASSINYRAAIVGPIEGGCTLGVASTILGQSVTVDARTALGGGFTCTAGTAGQIVEVSGLRDSAGRIRATRVNLISAGFVPGTTLLVRGALTAPSASARTFQLQGVTIDYGSAAVSGGSIGGGFTSGSMVVVRASTLPSSGRLVATRVDVEAAPASNVGKQAEIEGLVTRFASTTDFDVAGKRVSVTPSTTFEHGTAADIVMDRELHVTGVYDATNTIIASKIEIESESEIELRAAVSAVDPIAKTLTVFGTPGIRIIIDARTQLEDETGLAGSRFNLSNILVGDSLELTVRPQTSGYSATTLKRVASGGAPRPVRLKATVQAVGTDTVTLLGVAVDAAATPLFRNAAGNSISRAAFFGAIVAGQSRIEARGSFDGTRILATTELRFASD